MDKGPWRAVNDPGAWGSAAPEVLVLGFSKGFTQATAARSGPFEAIPFKKMRPRLSEVLQVLGVLQAGEQVDARMVATERDIAFGSLVRCSLSRFDEKAGKHACTGPIMTKAFTETAAAPLVKRCAETYLKHLPPSVRLVLMLGTGDSYIEGCRRTIRALHGAAFTPINEVAYRTGSVTWVHVSHPSGLNGYHGAWMTGDPTTKQGQKRRLAEAAVAASRLITT
ncbi:hypothetical protein FV219_00895 [Methylobacterium sp. WL122]|nr:hypothetical protein FV219_00895 [Methylobacterium sp. WL122]